MAGEPILDSVFDAENLEKLSRRGIYPEDLYDILEGLYQFGRNRAGRRGSHLLIGRNWNNHCLAVPVEATGEAGVWRPITGWDCKPSELARLGQVRRRR